MPTIAEFQVEVTAKLDTLLKDLKKTERQGDKTTRRLEKGFDKVGKSLKRVGTQLAVFFGARQILRFANDTLKWADSITEVSARLGLTIKEVQVLEQVAQRTNTPFNQLVIAVQRFSRRLAEAREGAGEALATLQKMGALEQEFDGVGDAFFFVVEKLNEIEDSSERTLATFKLFDSEGVQAINRVRGVLVEMNEELSKSGRLLSENQIEALVQTEIAWEQFAANTKLALRDLFGDFAQWLALINKGLQAIGALDRSVAVMNIEFVAWSEALRENQQRVKEMIAQGAGIEELNEAWAEQRDILEEIRDVSLEINAAGGLTPVQLADQRRRSAAAAGEGAAGARNLAAETAAQKLVETTRKAQFEVRRIIAESYNDQAELIRISAEETLAHLQAQYEKELISFENLQSAKEAIADATQQRIDELSVGEGDDPLLEKQNIFNDALGQSINLLGQLGQGGEDMGKRIGLAFAQLTIKVLADLARIKAEMIAAGIVSIVSRIGGAFGGGAAGGANAGVASSQTSLIGRFNASGFQHGGIARGMTLVGERGPELVNFASPGRVFPNHATASAASGGGDIIVNVRNENQTADVSASRKNPGVVDIIIGTVTSDIASGGPVSRSMERMYGSQRKGRVR